MINFVWLRTPNEYSFRVKTVFSYDVISLLFFFSHDQLKIKYFANCTACLSTHRITAKNN